TEDAPNEELGKEDGSTLEGKELDSELNGNKLNGSEVPLNEERFKLNPELGSELKGPDNEPDKGAKLFNEGKELNGTLEGRLESVGKLDNGTGMEELSARELSIGAEERSESRGKEETGEELNKAAPLDISGKPTKETKLTESGKEELGINKLDEEAKAKFSGNALSAGKLREGIREGKEESKGKLLGTTRGKLGKLRGKLRGKENILGNDRLESKGPATGSRLKPRGTLVVNKDNVSGNADRDSNPSGLTAPR
ncbi:MAG: hypothetical protein WDW20_04935, partial [Neisseriaceae bacterium]